MLAELQHIIDLAEYAGPRPEELVILQRRRGYSEPFSTNEHSIPTSSEHPPRTDTGDRGVRNRNWDHTAVNTERKTHARTRERETQVVETCHEKRFCFVHICTRGRRCARQLGDDLTKLQYSSARGWWLGGVTLRVRVHFFRYQQCAEIYT